jgi:enoyl-[acyl-carrier protein] reductase I
MRTLAGAGISDARVLFNYQKMHSPLNRTPSLDEVGGAALYLLSDLSTAVTGEIHYVDSGYNIVAMPRPETIKETGEGTASLQGNGNGGDHGEMKPPRAAE